jgi:hypothetical protein
MTTVSLADRSHVYVSGAHEDQVRALVLRERARSVGDAEVDRSVDGGALDESLRRERIKQAGLQLD